MARRLAIERPVLKGEDKQDFVSKGRHGQAWTFKGTAVDI